MANQNPMAPIVRGSTKETLEQLYNNINTTQPTALLRDNLTNFTLNSMAWAKSKTAGAPNFAMVNVMNGNGIRGGLSGWDSAVSGFGPASVGRTSITAGGLNYARLGFAHSNEKYR